MFMHTTPSTQSTSNQRSIFRWLFAFFSGALLPLGFAPFHLPGFALIGLALFFGQLSYGLTKNDKPARKQAFIIGFIFGLGYLGFGVSWVYVSIHNYGHLDALLSGLITLLFIAYLSLFTGFVAYTFQALAVHRTKLLRCLIFSALWCLGEYCRSTLLTGFPWMLLGFGQMDTPLKYLLPLVGVYGVSFLTCLAGSCLAIISQEKKKAQLPWLFALVGLILSPLALQNKAWTKAQGAPISIGVIQADLSMRDKWDEALFLNVLSYYKSKTEALMGKKQLIVMPESAIPAPDSYVRDFLESIHQNGLVTNTSVLLGIPEEPSRHTYYNAMLGLGNASGSYQKKHLVPFGEFIPKPFQHIMNWLSIPLTDITKGRPEQPLIEVDGHPIATLICYELAYPNLLRAQLPRAEWIVSISDDGWFGHSFAMYQQLQMAQALSIQTGRYQIVANNDGLSSVINPQGVILDSLPAYQAGILSGQIYSTQGATPWVIWGDAPVLLFSLMMIMYALIRQLKTLKISHIVDLDSLSPPEGDRG
jgi:apolipoprotein N-acyltransferase